LAGYALHDRLGYRVSRLARILQSQVERILAPEGLTRMTWLVLTAIGEDRVRTPSALAGYIGITRPASSRLLRRMEAAGHVCRGGGDSDGRSITLALTDRGRAVLARRRPEIDALSARFAAKLDPATYRLLLDGLGRLAEGEGGAFTHL
jgi:DNA-binding MarR family transcriptional regulator